MKALTRILALALPIALAISCRPEQPTDPGPAYGAGDGVPGTWKQSSATIYDITLPVPEAEDISGYATIPGNEWIISFSSDGTYTVDQAGKGENPFGTAGTFAFDTAYYPTEMMITPTGGTSKMVNMLNAPRESDTYFGLSFEVEQCGEAVARYEYTFTRQN
ncbi:MAG: hypothetical protein HWE14_09485 [Flavobacteriia bacterium]|nr:hypothetical protein [Flavobacteriia bacterium]